MIRQVQSTWQGRSWRLGAILAAGMLLAGCAGGGSPQPTATATTSDDGPVSGGVLVQTLPNDPGTLDMAVSTLQVTQTMGSNVFESLFALDKAFQPQPMLVDSVEMSDDRTVYTLGLRGGVTFHDGSELDSGDVAASLERFFTVSPSGAGVAADVVSVEAPDPLTVVITLAQPRHSLLGELAASAALILPEEIATAAGANPLTGAQTIGTGPYQLGQYQTGQSVTLERFDEYSARAEGDWGGQAGMKHAYLDGIEFRFVAEDSTVVNGLTTGQWQMSAPSNDQYSVLQANPNITLTPIAGGVVNTVILNHHPDSAFADVEARRALNLVINKEDMAAVSGTAPDLLTMTGAFQAPENAPLFSEAGTDVYESYDPERAKEQFATAGVDTIRMLVPSNFPQMVAWGNVLQQELTDIGLTVEIESYDLTTVRAKATDEPGSWDLSLTFISGTVVAPPLINWLQQKYIGGYQNDELDELFAEYAAAEDASAAKQVVDRIQQLVWDDIPSIVLYGSKQYVALDKSVKGFDGNFMLALYNTWLDAS
ncbi:MAG TPA: ABC transporter substrate-binding protein [Microbacteriaceae bacterium]|nr:ABC transporter substrate-binding protein [Microbacteriaceae bacterium]